jgi:DNA modification methylase
LKTEIVQLPRGDDPPTARLLYGATVIEALQSLDAGLAHLACTSPPYWGLRDYGVPPQDWPEVTYAPMPGLPEVIVPAQQVSLGLEPDPYHYIGHLVLVFRELRRVLRDDGVLYVNLGDSYTGGGGSSGHTEDTKNLGRSTASYGAVATGGRVAPGLKAKDMGGIPWRAALALQADGWWLRNDIIWAKASCMPEPVKDRCTRNHEYIFMLAKSSRYFYDHVAIKEPLLHPTHSGSRFGGDKQHVKHRPTAPDHWSYSGRAYDASKLDGKNKRTVWNVNPRPYPGAHFAVWPPALVEPMIKAGTSERGVCGECGAPYKRVDDGWERTCEHDADVVRPIVLDPFSGSATTGMVALDNGRDYIGIDLNDEFLPLARARILGDKPPGQITGPEEGSIFDMFG